MKDNVSSFLHSGYYYDYNPENEMFKNFNNKDVHLSEREVKDYLCKLVEFLALKNSGSEIIVPLSGGFDSRLILASLLEVFDADKIYTFTFGVPGSLDFDIANLVARKCGTKHTNIDLGCISFELDSLLYNSSVSDDQTICFYSTPFAELKKIYSNEGCFWSGFMGDPVAGSKFKHDKVGQCLSVSKSEFLKDNALGSSFDIDVDTKDLFEGKTLTKLSDGKFSSYEEFNFFNRQLKYIRPHVAPNERYITPFVDTNWARYWSSIPEIYKVGTKGYEKFCMNNFSDIFSLPSKNNFGLGYSSIDKILSKFFRVGNRMMSLNAIKSRTSYVDKRQNYFDFNLKSRSDVDFRKLIDYLISVTIREFKLNNVDYYKCNLTSFDENNPYNKMVLASLGLHILNGKSIEGAY